MPYLTLAIFDRTFTEQSRIFELTFNRKLIKLDLIVQNIAKTDLVNKISSV